MYQRSHEVRYDEVKCSYNDCNRIFRTRAALKITRKDYTDTLPLHQYLYGTPAVMNLNRKMPLKTTSKDVMGQKQ